MSSAAEFRNGTIEHVLSNYGLIKFDDANSTASKAYFDFESVGNAVDDLTVHFKEGMKVKAKTKEALQGDANDRRKAYCVMLIEYNDPTIRGGDIYLKKLLERIGPQELDPLPSILLNQTDNCPKFLKSNDIDSVKKVVLSRPDWFMITNNDCLTVIPSEESAQEALLSILRKQDSIPVCDFDDVISKFKKINGYLTTTNLADFVSRHADSLVIWKDSVWSCKSLGEDTENGKQFQNDMMAVKYYSQFVEKDTKVAINVLRGHYSQASKTVQQAVKSKDPDFRLFWKQNNFFFVLDEKDAVSCYSDRLPILDLYWCLPQDQTENATPENTSETARSTQEAISRNDSDHLCAVDNEKMEGLLKKHLEQNGAINLLDFNQTNINQWDVECQSEGLQQLGMDELRQMAKSSPSIFSIRNEYLCLNSQEELCIKKMIDFLESSPCTVADLKRKFESDPKNNQYIINNCLSENGIYDFLSRNSDYFLFWKNSIYLCNQLLQDYDKIKLFKAEMRAVQYYAKFIRKNCSTPIVSVRGHYAQATEEIRKVAHSRPLDFVEFLKCNEFFFKVSEDSVKMSDQHFRNLSLINKWLHPNFEGNSPILSMALSSLDQSKIKCRNNDSSDGDSEIKPLEGRTESIPCKILQDDIQFPIQESRAFIEDIPSKTPIPAEETPPPDLHDMVPVLKNDVLIQHSISNEQLSIPDFGSNEIFQRILGDELCNAIRKRLSLESQVNNLILLRLHVGSHMKARLWDARNESYKKATIGDSVVKQSDLNRVLRSDDVIKITDGQHYGIKGTLHTMNVMEQDGEVCEVTIFYQLHVDSDGLALDIGNGESLQAVFPGHYPDKWIYNFLRTRSKALSESQEVLILDKYGKMSGCDGKPHSTVGDDVVRIICTESNLTSRILDAIPHKRQYVIITGVDSLKQFEAVEKMCGKGIVVIAEVSNICKSRAKQLLS